eukprot:Em0002g464a
MNVTEANRRHWIEIEIPPVTAVLEKFPCLVEPSVMVNEFQHITKVYHEDVLERWIGVQSKILAYGKTCGKTNVKKFLSELSAAKQSCNNETVYALHILMCFLGHKIEGNEFFKPFLGEYISLNDAIVGTSCNSPYIAAFGKALADLTDPVVVVEKTVLLYALSKDITVCLWLEYRSLNGSTPLRDVSGGDFVIVNEELHGEFDEFRSKVYAYVDKEYSIVEAVELLQVWCRAREVSLVRTGGVSLVRKGGVFLVSTGGVSLVHKG